MKNLQGDVTGIVNRNKELLVEYNYDAWGNILSITDTSDNSIGTINPIRYRTYYYDTDTGFYYLQSRYYDPEIKRFINADGYVNANGDILGFNMYAYCGNNPVNYVDYSGEFWIWIQTIAPVVKVFICIAFIICEIASPSKEEHYNRDAYNLVPDDSELQDIVNGESSEWYAVDDKHNKYHRFANGVQGEEAQYNKKYQTLDGKNEVIICYNENYVPTPYIVTDPNNKGTFNYGPGMGINHFLKDIYPYWKWGNSPDDTTKRYERIVGN